MKQTLLYFLTFVTIQVVCGLAIGSGNAGASAETIMLASAVSSVITLIVFAITRWQPFSLKYLKSNPWVTLYWTALISLGMLIPSQFVEELIPEAFRQDLASDALKLIMGSPWGYVVIGILAPLTEEVVFRGAIQRAVLKHFSTDTPKRLWAGIAFTALLFAVVHGNPAQMPHAFLIGLLLGWMAYRSGSIVPGILLHVINNSVAFVLYQVYPQSYDMTLIDFFGNSALRLTGAIVLSLCIFIPALRQLHLHLKTHPHETKG